MVPSCSLYIYFSPTAAPTSTMDTTPTMSTFKPNLHLRHLGSYVVGCRCLNTSTNWRRARWALEHLRQAGRGVFKVASGPVISFVEYFVVAPVTGMDLKKNLMSLWNQITSALHEACRRMLLFERLHLVGGARYPPILEADRSGKSQ